MSTETETVSDTLTELRREAASAMALRILKSLEALEEEHSNWLSALRAQELLDTAGHYGLEEDSDWLEEAAEHRETVRLYLEREAEEYGQCEAVSEDRDPVWLLLESSLDLVTVWESRSGEEPEPRGWELLLCSGGPSAGLELDRDGRATVWATNSKTERVYGRLEWLAGWLEESGL